MQPVRKVSERNGSVEKAPKACPWQGGQVQMRCLRDAILLWSRSRNSQGEEESAASRGKMGNFWPEDASSGETQGLV
ncbi:unnamed protein product [Prunus armeniaca]|uniref:Uncharacterized protein n=1 Tax=Prunus armeniaca TaxID=36596 RepID=A0A6J5U325_PRUAR|nr:unnamed protein product [Prunus armeniaca]CAB4270560.1 unnamed protein product [Prunus armeniaca]